MKWHRIFFWILLTLFPTQLGYHFWPDWAMVLGRRVDYLSPTLFLTDLLILFTVGSFLIYNLKFSIFNKFSIFKRKHLVLFATILFVIFNIAVAVNKPVALYKWLKVAELMALGWYIVKSKPSLAFVIFPLSIGVLYSSVLAIAQFFLQHSVGGPLWWLGERTFRVDTPGIARIVWFGQELLRPYATFPHPNVLGGFLAATLPLMVSNQTKKLSFFKIATIALGTIAMFLTFSRSAIVVGVIAIILMIASRKQQVVSSKVAIVIFLIFSLATFYFLLTTNFSDESVVVRQQLNAAAVKIWQESPLVGVGLGNFLVELPKALPSRSVYFLQPVHNIYLLVLTETGIVGLVFFLWLLWQIARKKSFSILYSLFSILALGLIDHYPLTLQQGQLLLTLFLALSFIQTDRTIGK
jgi:hypothetical protein